MTAQFQQKIDLHRALPTPPMRRALRKASGLTQQDVAAELGCDRVTVGRYEAGTRTPRGERLVKYLEILATLRETP